MPQRCAQEVDPLARDRVNPVLHPDAKLVRVDPFMERVDEIGHPGLRLGSCLRKLQRHLDHKHHQSEPVRHKGDIQGMGVLVMYRVYCPLRPAHECLR